MRIRIKRTKRAEAYNHNRLDLMFVNGNIEAIPMVGERLKVTMDRLGYGTWHTTPVTEVYSTKTTIVLKTQNSTYHVKLGWKEI